jgi:transcriptional regulator with XRE-family HTH domain
MHPITKRRRALGLTQDELGRLVQVSTRTIGKWEDGTRPRPGALVKLARALDVSPAVLDAELLASVRPGVQPHPPAPRSQLPPQLPPA